MDKEYLLTYSESGKPNFKWFDNQEEMQEFVDNNNKLDGIYSRIKINDYEEVDIDFDFTK